MLKVQDIAVIIRPQKRNIRSRFYSNNYIGKNNYLLYYCKTISIDDSEADVQAPSNIGINEAHHGIEEITIKYYFWEFQEIPLKY